MGLSRYQVSKLVYNACQAAFGFDAIAKVEQLYSSCKGKEFLHYSTIFSDFKGAQRIMLFSTKELMSLLVYLKVSHLAVYLAIGSLAGFCIVWFIVLVLHKNHEYLFCS